LGKSQLGYYLDYNYAYLLHKAGVESPPRNARAAMCDGLRVMYQFDGQRYKEFLAEILVARSVNIVSADASKVQRDKNGAIILSVYPELPAETGLLIDFWWVKNVKTTCEKIVKNPSRDFFALNRLEIKDSCTQQINYAGPWMLERRVIYSDDAEPNRTEALSFWADGQIKMGADGLKFRFLDSAERVFFWQLQSLLMYWPEQRFFSLVANKMNREWCAWQSEVNDFENLILTAAGCGPALSSENTARMDLFREVGALPEHEGAIFENAEWENILVAGLGLEPGYRCLPLDITEAEGLAYARRVKESCLESF
jgi:hypothetical protein